MLHFVLCDDNLTVLNRLDKVLNSIFIKNNIDAEVSCKANCAEEVFEFIENNDVDVLFLDINLQSQTSGCDIADIVRKKNKNVYIIFLTGHFEYALLAYKYKTFDYLLKPITCEKLEETITRLIEDMKDSQAKYLKINNSTIIKEDDINYIKKDGMKLVFCTSKHNYETYSSFSKIENCLPGNFVRCHKSFIINVNNVKQFAKANNTVEFGEDICCSVGSKYKNKFLEVFENGSITNHLECVNK